jgi:hypothetical protein
MGLINLKQLKSSSFNQLGKSAMDQVPGLAGKMNLNFNENGFQSISGNFNNILKKGQRKGRGNTKLGSLYEPNGGMFSAPIMFPPDLSDEHYMIFNVMDRKRPAKDDVLKTKAIRSVILPVPSSLTNEQGVSYSNENLGVVGKMAAGGMSAGDMLTTGGDILEEVGSGLKGLAGAASNAVTGDKNTENQSSGGGGFAAMTMLAAVSALAKTKLGGAAGGLLAIGGGEQIMKGIGSARGIAKNPHTAVLFDNVNFRSFAFSYDFVARNADESAIINHLIQVFQYYMHPSSAEWGGGAFFSYPEEFQIEFSDHIKHTLFKINRCVLKSVNVNYNGSSIPIFFEDSGAPVHIKFTLSFQETELLTKEKLTNPKWSEAMY